MPFSHDALSSIDWAKVTQAMRSASDELTKLPTHVARENSLRKEMLKDLSQVGVPGDDRSTAAMLLRQRIDAVNDLRRSITQLETAMKNLLPVLQKWDQQAAKDAETLLASAGTRGEGAFRKDHPIYRAQVSALKLFRQKAELPIRDLANLNAELARSQYGRVPEVQKISTELSTRMDRIEKTFEVILQQTDFVVESQR